MMKVRTPFDKANCISRAPHAFVEHCCFSAGRDECDAITVISHPPKPFNGLLAEWRIAPHAAFPWLLQSVIVHVVVLCSGVPGANNRRAWIEAEQAKLRQDFRWREPFILAHYWRLMSG